MNTSFTQHTVYTIGYRAPGAMEKVQELVTAGALLLDIRLTPASRFYPQWNRMQLQQRFGDEDYEHLGQLGNVNYRHPERPMQLYDAEEGLLWLLVSLKRRDVVLLCGCPDPAKCHRSLVCTLLKQRMPQVPIVHLISCPSLTPPWEERHVE